VTALALVILCRLPDNDGMAKKKRKPKTPGLASFAFGVLQHVIEATGDKPDEPKPAQDQSGKDPAAVALGRKGGLKGGKARAAKMTKEQRSESARKAAQARWRSSRRPHQA
jgi:hypothetical protein